MQHINIINFIIITGIFIIGLLLYVLIKTLIQSIKSKNKPQRF
jgi:hypothetical protein